MSVVQAVLVVQQTMRTKRVTRYYCDHCGRGKFHADSMARHESICYRNPQRKCLLCEGDPGQAISDERKRQIEGRKAACRTVAGECPDCMMAFVLAYNRTVYDSEDCLTYDIAEYRADRRAILNERWRVRDAL